MLIATTLLRIHKLIYNLLDHSLILWPNLHDIPFNLTVKELGGLVLTNQNCSPHRLIVTFPGNWESVLNRMGWGDCRVSQLWF